MRKLKINWPLLALPVAQVVFFWNILIGRRFFLDDAVQQYYPTLSYLANSLRRFELPYWSPYVFCGTPFIGDVQTQTFYPFAWIMPLFIGSDGRLEFLAVELLIIVHLLIAGLLMYRLMREFSVTPEGSAFAGLTFMFSGFMILRIVHLTAICTFAWLPLVFLLLHRSLYRRCLAQALWAGVVFGLAALAGHPQFLMYMGYCLALYALFFVIRRWPDLKGEAIWRSAASLALIAVIGIGIAAIQYLPSAEFVQHTSRSAMNYNDIVEASLKPIQLITLLVPKFFGSVSGDLVTHTDTVNFWGGHADYVYWETVIYIGILPLLLALFALTGRKHPLRWFCLVLAALALLLALGRYTPVYRLVLTALPGLNRFRIPGRLAALLTFALALLAGLGLESLLGKAADRVARTLLRATAVIAGVAALIWVLFAVGVLRAVSPAFADPMVYASSGTQWGIFVVFLIVALGTLVYRTRRQFVPAIGFWTIIVVSFFDLYLFGHNFNATSFSPGQYAFPLNQVLTQLQRESNQEAFRINMRRGPNMLMGRNQGNLDRIELLEGYTPLGVARYAPFAVPTPQMIDLLNAKYKIDSAGRTLVPNPGYLPRARMVYRYQLARSDSEALRIVRRGEYDYRSVAIVEANPGFPTRAGDSVRNHVAITRREPNRMELAVETDEPGILFLSEVYYPEWRAELDGSPVPIYPIDYALRGITIPAGSHRVAMYYDGRWVRNGAVISLLTLVLALLTALALGGRRRAIAQAQATDPAQRPAPPPSADAADG
jgi:hypothetical protein